MHTHTHAYTLTHGTHGAWQAASTKSVLQPRRFLPGEEALWQTSWIQTGRGEKCIFAVVAKTALPHLPADDLHL